jgi:uncharacterized protein YndB with AHSA1/START domain
MQTVQVTQDFTLPVDRVYAYLAEHENLGPLFGAKITRIRDGLTSRNGEGSVRSLRVGPGPAFEETIVEAVENERIVYRITKGSPLRGHRGEMKFSPLSTGSRLDYTITFGSAIPGLDRIVKLGLERTVRKGLKTIDQQA